MPMVYIRDSMAFLGNPNMNLFGETELCLNVARHSRGISPQMWVMALNLGV